VIKLVKPNVKTSIFVSEYGGYGYNVLVNNKLFVHQPCLPAFEGRQGFPSEKRAQKAAQLVVDKILKNQIPPSLSISEVKEILDR